MIELSRPFKLVVIGEAGPTAAPLLLRALSDLLELDFCLTFFSSQL